MKRKKKIKNWSLGIGCFLLSVIFFAIGTYIFVDCQVENVEEITIQDKTMNTLIDVSNLMWVLWYVGAVVLFMEGIGFIIKEATNEKL